MNEAGQEKERMINEAQQAYNEKIPKAVGEARQTVTQAEGYALERVNRSEGEAKRFLDILAEYQKGSGRNPPQNVPRLIRSPDGASRPSVRG